MSSIGGLDLLYPVKLRIVFFFFFKESENPYNAELFIVMTEEGNLTCQVNKRDGKE